MRRVSSFSPIPLRRDGMGTVCVLRREKRRIQEIERSKRVGRLMGKCGRFERLRLEDGRESVGIEEALLEFDCSLAY